MKKLIRAAAFAVVIPFQSAWGQALSGQAAVALAERFVVENGYADASRDRIKQQLNFESIERADNRNDLLKQRRNTLKPKAIGAKRGRRGRGNKEGWSVAFDYTPAVHEARTSCRVVTMAPDGSSIRIEHVDGIRKYFAGFDFRAEGPGSN